MTPCTCPGCRSVELILLTCGAFRNVYFLSTWSKSNKVLQIISCYFNHRRKETLYLSWQRCKESDRVLCHNSTWLTYLWIEQTLHCYFMNRIRETYLIVFAWTYALYFKCLKDIVLFYSLVYLALLDLHEKSFFWRSNMDLMRVYCICFLSNLNTCPKNLTFGSVNLSRKQNYILGIGDYNII